MMRPHGWRSVGGGNEYGGAYLRVWAGEGGDVQGRRAGETRVEGAGGGHADAGMHGLGGGTGGWPAHLLGLLLLMAELVHRLDVGAVHGAEVVERELEFDRHVLGEERDVVNARGGVVGEVGR